MVSEAVRVAPEANLMVLPPLLADNTFPSPAGLAPARVGPASTVLAPTAKAEANAIGR